MLESDGTAAGYAAIAVRNFKADPSYASVGFKELDKLSP